jgi:hypothetical protein
MGAGYGTADFADDSPEAQAKGGSFAGDVLPGAVGGAVLTPVMGALGDRFSRWLKTRSQDNALKAMGARAGISNQLAARGYETADEARQLGQSALDMDLVSFGGTAEGVARKTAEAKQHYGAMLEDALGLAGDAPFDFDRAAWQAAQKAHGPEGLTTEALAQAAPAARNVGRIVSQGNLDNSFKAANRLKSDIYGGINYKVDPGLKTSLQQKVASGLRGSIEDQLAEVAGPEAADQLRTANQRYGQLADIGALASDEATRQQGRASPGVMTLALSSLGASSGYGAGGFGGGVMGGVAPLAAKYLAPRIPSTMAVTQSALAPRAPGMTARAMQGIQTWGAEQQSKLKPEEEAAVSAFLSLF